LTHKTLRGNTQANLEPGAVVCQNKLNLNRHQQQISENFLQLTLEYDTSIEKALYEQSKHLEYLLNIAKTQDVRYFNWLDILINLNLLSMKTGGTLDNNYTGLYKS
jgi:hypothetical protein